MCHTFSIPFPAHKDEEQYELAHDEQTHSLNSIQKWPAIATQWNGHVFVMGLTSPEHLGRPLTSKVH
jgi:hypothetical protein